MPPKKRKKSKKDKPPPIEYMPQMDKAFYETEINGIKDKIKLYQDQHELLQRENGELFTKKDFLTDNRTDELAKISLFLRDKELQVKSRKHELNGLRQLKEQEATDHVAKLKELTGNFHEMVKSRTNANKLLKSHLNVLQIYKANEIQLKQTVEDLEETFNQREQVHKAKIKKEQIKYKVNRIAVQDNLIQKLLWSSVNAATVLDAKVPAHVERLARENFALESEIDRVTLLNKAIERKLLRDDNKKIEFRDEINRNWRRNIKTETVVRNNVKEITGLSKKIDRIQSKGDELRNFELDNDEMDKQKVEIEMHQRNSLQVLHGLRQYLHVLAHDRQHLNYKLALRRKELAKLNSVLYRIQMHSQMIRSFEDNPHENIFSCVLDEAAFRQDQFERFPDVIMSLITGIEDKISGFSVSTFGSVDIRKSVSDVVSEDIDEEVLEVFEASETVEEHESELDEEDEPRTPPLRKASLRKLSQNPIIDLEVDENEALVFEDNESSDWDVFDVFSEHEQADESIEQNTNQVLRDSVGMFTKSDIFNMLVFEDEKPSDITKLEESSIDVAGVGKEDEMEMEPIYRAPLKMLSENSIIDIENVEEEALVNDPEDENQPDKKEPTDD